MFYVMREIHFSYGHRLMDYVGPCANLHGHNAKVLLEVSSQKLNPQGMVIDFYDLRETIGKWIKENLDHKTILWDKDPLAAVLREKGEVVVTIPENPTAEVLAKWIFDEARRLRLPVSRVTVWETENNAAIYHE